MSATDLFIMDRINNNYNIRKVLIYEGFFIIRIGAYCPLYSCYMEWNLHFKNNGQNARRVSLENENDFLALRELWDKHKAIISISVPHTESDEMEKAIVTLQTKFENNISFGFSEAVALTIKAIDEIKVHGTASLDNVL